ncbi:MAG: class I SAM-dependent methyltransferase [Candidatus Methanomethylophilaceae archaeon]|nr:class I SAM-dependent methyltransferase [Candidatus Methanomethylophilaceae archaeon]
MVTASLVMDLGEKEEQRRAWERLYRQESRAWRGVNRLDLPLSPGIRALDIGCGNGKSTAYLLESGCEVTGIDVSETAVQGCRERFPSAAFQVADATLLPFPDGSYDLVLMVHVLEHLDSDSRTQAMQEAWRVLAEGGTIYLQAFNRQDLRYGKGEKGTEEHSFRRGNGIVYHYFDADEIASLAPEGCLTFCKEQVDPVRFANDERRARWVCRFLRPSSSAER